MTLIERAVALTLIIQSLSKKSLKKLGNQFWLLYFLIDDIVVTSNYIVKPFFLNPSALLRVSRFT